MDGLHRSTIVLLLVRRYGLSVLHHHLLVGRAGSCPLQTGASSIRTHLWHLHFVTGGRLCQDPRYQASLAIATSLRSPFVSGQRRWGLLARLLDKECPPLPPLLSLSTSGGSLDPRRAHCGDVRQGIGSVCELSPCRPSSSPAGNFLHSSVVVSWCCDIVSAYNRCVCSKPLRWRSGTSAPRVPSSSLELALENPAYSQELFFVSSSVIA